jgi:hypothetical protein
LWPLREVFDTYPKSVPNSTAKRRASRATHCLLVLAIRDAKHVFSFPLLLKAFRLRPIPEC